MKTIEHDYDFVVVGGGLAGICAAVTAARQGVKTALVQDRPVLGGNGSSEIRVPPVGASNCNFAYSRETGLVEELYLNNLQRNPTWNWEGWNLEYETLVRNEPDLDLFLNCAVCEVEVDDSIFVIRDSALDESKRDDSSFDIGDSVSAACPGEGTDDRRINASSNNDSTPPDSSPPDSSNTDSSNTESTNQPLIQSVKAYCSLAETWHVFRAPLFADCSGDGVVGALAGAAFRVGVEARAEFDEPMCPDEATTDTMGMSLHLHARDAGRPMPFLKPAWVDMELGAEDFGPYRPVCEHFFPDTGGFWWLEWGGALDTVHDTMAIKDEVQRITLAVWDYLKNRSPLAERLATYELDWMGAVPGKRESRRFEGDHMLTMADIDQQVHFEDAVAYGGWGFDHHPPAGFHDKVNPSTHQHLRGPHNVPLRSLYSRNVDNLFFAGRNISATHYALSSTRVMLTCAQLGEAVGMAAARAVRLGCQPRQLLAGDRIREIQRALIRADHHIHGLGEIPVGQAFLPVPDEIGSAPHEDRQECLSYSSLKGARDLAPEATVSASSVFSDQDTPLTWGTDPLTSPRMQLLPLLTERVESIALRLDASEVTQLPYRLMQGAANGATYPEQEIHRGSVDLTPGVGQWVTLPMQCKIDQPGWHFLVVDANSLVRLHLVEAAPGRIVYGPRHEDPIRPNPFSAWAIRSVPIRPQAADASQAPRLEWCDHALGARDLSRFLSFSYVCRVTPEQPVYGPAMAVNAHSRPTTQPNLWVSAATVFDEAELLTLSWDRPQDVTGVQVLFDSALHAHFGQSWQGYAVNAIPSLVKDYRIVAARTDGTETIVADVQNNHRRNCSHVAALRDVTGLRLECLATNGIDRVQVYALRVFGK